MNQDDLNFINNLIELPHETEWLEFKSNYQDKNKIGEYISALANSASFHKKDEAYLIFGVNDKTHKIEGTTFDIAKEKGAGNFDLEPWLNTKLKPHIEFYINDFTHPEGRLVIFTIRPAMNGPVRFLEKKYIRIGSNNQNLSNFLEREAIIWDRRVPFEKKIAYENINKSRIFELLDYQKYLILTNITEIKTEEFIIDKFRQEQFIKEGLEGFHITNLGAILLARDLSEFPKLKNKSARVITYADNNRLECIKDETGVKGYAVGFDGLINYIESQIPEREIIEGRIRKTIVNYPKKTIREFVVNSLLHQDFSLKGGSPLIEIFSDRIEISNPGIPLIEPNRFMDSEPKSRNEELTDSLRRMNICEKRGSGIDRAIFEIEIAQLPAPKIEEKEDSIKVTIYSRKSLNQLTKEEQSRACYFHSCIRSCIDQKAMTNGSLCKRLGIAEQNKAIASRIIKETLRLKLIKPFDPNSNTRKYAKYLPFWG